MAINFNALPDNASANLLVEGKHLVKIVKAEMKTSTKGNELLNLQLDVFNDKGNKIGTIFDMLMDSDKPLLQYKLKRFIIGFQIPITGTFELKDLCKIVVGKEAYAELTIQHDERYPDKTQVDATKNEIYYPLKAVDTMEQALADLPFNTVQEDEEEEF